MSYWMVNGTSGHADIDIKRGNEKSEHDGVISYRVDSTNYRFKAGDEFTAVSDNSEAEFVNEKVKLLNKGIISKTYEPIPIKTKDLTALELKKVKYIKEKKGKNLIFYYHRFDFAQAENYKEYKFLDDYSYSLLKVYKRYIKPVRHFSKIVTDIGETDFTTLKNENIFISRTIFGRLVNSMPYANRLQFLLYCLEEFKTTDLRKVHFTKATPILKKFIGHGILDMGKYLTESVEIIKSNPDLFGDYRFVGFVEENDLLKFRTRPLRSKAKLLVDNIYDQSLLFKNVFDYNKSFENLFSEEKFEIKKTVVEDFEKKFSKRPWPVDLNTDNL